MTSHSTLEKTVFSLFISSNLCSVSDPTETGCVWEPDVAAPHAGAGPEDSSLRAAAQRLPEEAA